MTSKQSKKINAANDFVLEEDSDVFDVTDDANDDDNADEQRLHTNCAAGNEDPCQ